MSQKVVIEKSGGPYRHVVKARGHELVIDAPKASKGGDVGMTPHEIFLAGLGACAAFTMEMKAAKEGWDLQNVTVTMEEDKVADPDHTDTTKPAKRIPRVVETIELVGNLTAEQVTALKDYAHKYCPVYQLFTGKKVVETMVSHSVPVSTPETAKTSCTDADAECTGCCGGDVSADEPTTPVTTAKESKPADPTCGA